MLPTNDLRDKMKWILLFCFVVTRVGLSVCVTCDAVTILGTPRPTGQDGAIRFVAPACVNSWNMKVFFSIPVTMYVWDGAETGCEASTTCSITNEADNGVVFAGNLVTISYQIWFPSTSVPPTVTTIVFNDNTICSSETFLLSVSPLKYIFFLMQLYHEDYR